MRIALGTDSGGDLNRFFIQGFFEHRQMELMVAAGLTPMQVIQAFSRNASEALGIDKEFGTLAVGKAADLLLVAKNPLDDIANMHDIVAVYPRRQGVRVTRCAGPAFGRFVAVAEKPSTLGHGRACPGHPDHKARPCPVIGVAGTSPAMTVLHTSHANVL